jgi:CBS domain-containing protein
MRIGELCTREVYLARREDPLATAAREMRRRHIGALVVVEARGKSVRPIGILTDRDIVCGQLVKGADLFCLNVGDVMTADPATVDEDDDLTRTIQRLAAAGVRRAPVVNSAGDLVGVISLDDLLPAVAHELSALAALIGTQSRVEPKHAHA